MPCFCCNMLIPWDPDYNHAIVRTNSTLWLCTAPACRLKSQNSSIPWLGIVILRYRCWHWRFWSERLAIITDTTCWAESWVRKGGMVGGCFRLEASYYDYKNSSFCLRTMKNVDQTTSIINSKTCNKYADHNFCFRCCQRVNGKCFGCRGCQYRCKTCKHGILYVEILTVGI